MFGGKGELKMLSYQRQQQANQNAISSRAQDII